MTPALRVTVALHAAGAIALALEPGLWRWVLGALLANHVVLAAGVFLLRGRLLGPNLSRLDAAGAAGGRVCLTFDDGPHAELTPRVLALLDEHQAKASFFCIGEKARAHPEIVREIARRGHSVENHTYRHSNFFALFGTRQLKNEIASAQAALAEITGRAPQFLRAPAGLRSPLLAPVLAAMGLRYVSWTRRGLDSVDVNQRRVLARLTSGLAAGDVLLLHDDRPRALEVLPALLDELAARGLKSVTLPSACSRS
jgi:peptidoglycan/xylan/chitin deacetylase (PgdA/CDA1 family)